VIDRRQVTGVILCGGDGRRMHGREKALELVGGKPLVAQVRARLAPQVGSIIISANRRLEEYAAWGDTVLADDRPGLGPLGGLLTALDQIETPYTFGAPGDAPLLSTALVARLATGLLSSGADVAIPHDGERNQPLFLLLRTTLRSSLRSFLAGSGRAVQAWIDLQRHVVVDAAADHESFANANAPGDLLRLDQLLTAAGACP
jgi:molybdopterin-guanine dinucleotide biosynthesis protein A